MLFVWGKKLNWMTLLILLSSEILLSIEDLHKLQKDFEAQSSEYRDAFIRCVIIHVINLDVNSEVLCYKSYVSSLFSLWNPLNMLAPEMETTSNSDYAVAKENHRSNLILVTHISVLGFDCSLSLYFNTMKTVILSFTLILEVWPDCFSCYSNSTSSQVN